MGRKDYTDKLKSEWRTLAFYRDLLAEFVGTFMLVSVQVALPLTWDRDNMGTVVQVSLFMGYVVATMAWTLGDFSGGHFNPAVSFAMVILAKVTVLRGLLYTGVQCAAGVAGAAWVNMVTPGNFTESLGATTLHPDVDSWQGFLIEAWITMMLVMTILGATNGRRKRPLYMPPIMIGMAISMGIAVGFNSTGGSMNPARSLGPAAIMSMVYDMPEFFDNHWVYWVGPLTGAAIAALVYSLLLDRVDRPDPDDEDNSGVISGVGLRKEVYINPTFLDDKL